MNVTWAGAAAIGVLLFTGYTGYQERIYKGDCFIFLCLSCACTCMDA